MRLSWSSAATLRSVYSPIFDVAQLLRFVAAQILIDLDDLQRGFGHFDARLRRDCDRLGPFALQPRFRAGSHVVDALCNDREIGARGGVVEADDDVAGMDQHAFGDIQFRNNAAGRMLYLLDAGAGACARRTTFALFWPIIQNGLAWIRRAPRQRPSAGRKSDKPDIFGIVEPVQSVEYCIPVTVTIAR